MAVTQAQLTEIYLAYFGRPPDFDGLVYYTSNPDFTIWTVAAGFSASPESVALYGPTFNAAQINAIYQNLFNRDAEPAGLLYWSQEVASGRLTAAGAALGILLGAQNDDLVAVNNKLAVSAAFVAALDTSAEITGYSGTEAAASARAFLHTVDWTQASVDSAMAGLPGAVAAAVELGGPEGVTVLLTTAIDQVTGTGGNDTFVGVNDDEGTGDMTLNLGDNINGGTGSDTLAVTLNTYSEEFTLAGVTLTSIEKFELTNVNELASDMDLNGNAFARVTLSGLQSLDPGFFGSYDINGLVSSSVVSVQGTKNAESSFDLNFDTNTDTAVAISNTVTGTGVNSEDAYFAFNHDLTAATTVTATLNALNMNADDEGYTWTDMYLSVGGADATITANVNVVGATSDDSDYSGAEMYIYQTDGSATVTANASIADSDSVYVGLYADVNGDSDGTLVDVANISLSNVSDSYDEANDSGNAGVYLEDFETINVSVSGASTLAYIDASGNNASVAFKSQTMTIDAGADLTLLGATRMSATGSTALVVTGSGNVDLGDFYGTGTTLSATVKSSIDASALTGDLSVEVANAIQSVKGGSGDDMIILGNTSTFGDTTLGGLVAAGGDGADTIGISVASWTTISGGTATQRAAISGFENLLLLDALATGDYDLAKLSGLTGFTAANGVMSANTATVKNVGNNASIGLAGDLVTNNGALALVLKVDGTDDALTLTIDSDIPDNNDTSSTATAITATVSAVGVETLNVVSTGTNSAFLGATGNKADTVTNTLVLTDDELVTLNVSGNQKFAFTVAATMEALETVNASAMTAGATIDGTAAAAALAITGSATAGNTLTGSAFADTIIGGAKADTIVGGAGADKLTGNAGNDTFAYALATDSTLSKLDVISDFSANTFGNGTAGAAGTGAGADATKWTGDVLSFDVDTGIFTKVAATAQANATNAQVYIQNTADATADTIIAALDSTTGTLYIDYTSDGTIDSVIQLTGVTTITAAAFVLV